MCFLPFVWPYDRPRRNSPVRDQNFQNPDSERTLQNWEWKCPQELITGSESWLTHIYPIIKSDDQQRCYVKINIHKIKIVLRRAWGFWGHGSWILAWSRGASNTRWKNQIRPWSSLTAHRAWPLSGLGKKQWPPRHIDSKLESPRTKEIRHLVLGPKKPTRTVLFSVYTAFFH